MNRDAKVGIIVLIVIFSGLGFVLLAAPKVKKDSLMEDRPSLFSSSKKPKMSRNQAFIDEDVSIEMMSTSSSKETTSVKKIPQKLDTPTELPIEKKPSKPEPELKKPNLAADNNLALKELEEALNAPLEKLGNKVEKGATNADKTKNEEKLILPNKAEDKPLESKVLEDAYYTVKEGDTLSNIAKALYQDTSKHKLISDANNGLNAKDLKIGMKLFIPGTESQKKFIVISKPLDKTTMVDMSKSVVYKVKAGDTISSIARKFFGQNYSMTDIKKANPGKDLSRLKIGESLNIPSQSKKNN